MLQSPVSAQSSDDFTRFAGGRGVTFVKEPSNSGTSGLPDSPCPFFGVVWFETALMMDTGSGVGIDC